MSIADKISAKGTNELDSSSLFDWRKYYDDFVYPIADDKPVPIDFRNEKMTYGKINTSRDWIYVIPKEDYFRDLPAKKPGKTSRVLNFVADAFEEFQVAIRNRVTTGRMSNKGVFSNITAEYGFANPQNLYNDYINYLYTSFVVGCLELGRHQLGAGIISFSTFMVAFLKWMRAEASIYPFTRTGYLSSAHISPRVSGLIIETHDADFSEDYAKHKLFLQDPNFEVYRTLALKYGFRLDRHAPWRLVADITSPYMQSKMFKYGLNKDNLFYTYFVPSYKYDVDVMRVVLYNWYNQYVTTYPQVKSMKTTTCKSHVFDNSPAQNFIVAKYTDRKRFKSTDEFDNNFGGLYWLRQYLYIRLREVSSNISDFRFKQTLKKVHNLYRFKDFDAAVTYINLQAKKYQPNAIMKKSQIKGATAAGTSTPTGGGMGTGY